MNVTFTCGKCGKEIAALYRPEPEQCAWPMTFVRSAVPDCPKCHPPKLTYGPLTEEMMRIALMEAADGGVRQQARFVLRLLTMESSRGVLTLNEKLLLADGQQYLNELARDE